MRELIKCQFSQQGADQARIYLFTPNNGNNSVVVNVVPVSLLLNQFKFHALFQCFQCWLWKSNFNLTFYLKRFGKSNVTKSWQKKLMLEINVSKNLTSSCDKMKTKQKIFCQCEIKSISPRNTLLKNRMLIVPVKAIKFG